MIFATWQVGQVLWSMLWFFLFFLLIWVVVAVFADVFRSPDLSGWAKALWTVFIVFVPWLGVFLYLLIRGSSVGDRGYTSGFAGGDTGRYAGSYSERVSASFHAPSTYGPR